MSKGFWFTLLFVFAALGAGARYGYQVIEDSRRGAPEATTYSHSGQRVSGPVHGLSRVAPAEVSGAMEGMAPADQYPLQRWRIDSSQAGELSQAYIAGPEPTPIGRRPLADDDVLLLSGWAGDALLGLRFAAVIISACDQVVGWADVDQPRPDVVRYIHSNLTSAGWTARLPVALLPQCPAATLRVWGAGPAGTLYPLQGHVPLPPWVAGQRPAEGQAHLPPGARAYLPEDTPSLHRAQLVLASTQPVRRCPGDECEVLGSLKRGSYAAARLDHRLGWSLIVTEGKAGWMTDEGISWGIVNGMFPPNLPYPVPRPPFGGVLDQLEEQSGH